MKTVFLMAFLSDLFGTVYASKSGGRFGICKSLRCVAHCAVEQFENGANFVWGDQLLERFCNGILSWKPLSSGVTLLSSQPRA